MAKLAGSIKPALVSRLLLDQDTNVRNLGVKERLDYIGDWLNDFKAQWNAEFPGSTITVADYDSKDYE